MKSGYFVAGLLIVLMAPAAWGFTRDPQCVADAAKTRNACRTTCNQTFQNAKDLCNSVDHACADQCRATRETCETPVYDALKACLDPCKATLKIALRTCATLFPIRGSVERDQCTDAAQLTAFMCRDTCRENMDANALAQCQLGFRDCIVLCPPSN